MGASTSLARSACASCVRWPTAARSARRRAAAGAPSGCRRCWRRVCSRW